MFFDVFNAHHQFFIHFGDAKEDLLGSDDSLVIPSALSVVSVGVGALMMVSGQAMGVRGLIEGVVCIMDLGRNKTTRKWAAPVLGVFTIGLITYVTPPTVGRRMKTSVVCGNGDESIC